MWPWTCNHPKCLQWTNKFQGKQEGKQQWGKDPRDTAKLIKSDQDKDTESEYDERKEKKERAKNNRQYDNNKIKMVEIPLLVM
jgi:hypothetical protein